MELEEKRQEKEWYDNPNLITWIEIGLIAIIIILSQAFAINNNLTATAILRSLFNHNITYLLGLIYFIGIKTYPGKKYFNFLNLFLVALYTLTSVASLLTLFQSFGLTTLISLGIHIVLLVYMIHTLPKGSRIWKEFKLERSPFNEITNEGYFYSIVVMSVVLLTVNLVGATTFDGIVIALLACIYMILLARYIYLYKAHTNKKDTEKKEVKKEKVSKTLEDKEKEEVIKSVPLEETEEKNTKKKTTKKKETTEK